MKRPVAYRSEYEIEADLRYHAAMSKGGGHALAYVPVVAGSHRGNIIHYTRNDALLAKGDLVLVDAGVNFHGYNSDITRTWPVSGRFTKEQAEIYEILLTVHEEALQVLPSNGMFFSLCLDG